MKTIRNIFVLMLVVAIIEGLFTQLSSCKKKDPTPTEDIVTKRLIANNWIMQSVTVDGADKTSVYPGLTIKFTESSFTTTHGGVVWPASGIWEYTSTDHTVIKRNDGLPVTVEVTDTTLKLSLIWATTTLGGRIASVQGQHVFNFVKQ